MKMRKSLIPAIALILLGLWPACNLFQEECEKNNTGTFYIENQSDSGRAYKILIDGISYGIVGAGATKDWTLAAGPHVVQILFADTDAVACSVSVPNVVKCKRGGLICRS